MASKARIFLMYAAVTAFGMWMASRLEGGGVAMLLMFLGCMFFFGYLIMSAEDRG